MTYRLVFRQRFTGGGNLKQDSETGKAPSLCIGCAEKLGAEPMVAGVIYRGTDHEVRG